MDGSGCFLAEMNANGESAQCAFKQLYKAKFLPITSQWPAACGPDLICN